VRRGIESPTRPLPTAEIGTAHTEYTVTTATFSTKLPTREEAGDRVMLQILDLLEHGRSQVLDRNHVEVIKSYLDEIDNYYS